MVFNVILPILVILLKMALPKRTLVECARSMLKVADLNRSFRAEAIATACYLENLSLTKALNHSTPYQLWTGLCSNLSTLRIVGYKAYSYIPD